MVSEHIIDDSDDRLTATTVGRIECGSGLFEGPYRSDEWAQPPVSKPVLQLGKPRAIGFDDEEDRPVRCRAGSAAVPRC